MRRRDMLFHRGVRWGGRRAFPALLLAAACTHAQAQTAGGDIAVTLTILSKSNCKFTTTPAAPALAFGSVHPGTTGAVTASLNATFECKGSAPAATFLVSAGNGLFFNGTRRMRHTNATSFLPYSVTLSPTTATAPKNTPVNLTVTATLAVPDFQDAIAGFYADTLVVSVTP